MMLPQVASVMIHPRARTRAPRKVCTTIGRRAGPGAALASGTGQRRRRSLSWQFRDSSHSWGYRAMFAVFEDGSRQYTVSEGDVVRVDFRDVEVGNEIEFDRVLLYRNEGDLQVG